MYQLSLSNSLPRCNLPHFPSLLLFLEQLIKVKSKTKVRLVRAGLGALQDSQLAKLLLMGAFLLSEMSHYLEVRFVSAPPHAHTPGSPVFLTAPVSTVSFVLMWSGRG